MTLTIEQLDEAYTAYVDRHEPELTTVDVYTIANANHAAEKILSSANAYVVEGEYETGHAWFQTALDHIQITVDGVVLNSPVPRVLIAFTNLLFGLSDLASQAGPYITEEQKALLDQHVEQWYNVITDTNTEG